MLTTSNSQPFVLSCGVVTGSGVCCTGIVQIKTNSSKVGSVTENGGDEELVEEAIQKNNPSHLYRSASIFTATVER